MPHCQKQENQLQEETNKRTMQPHTSFMPKSNCLRRCTNISCQSHLPSKYCYAIKPVPPAPTPIRREIDPTLEIIVLAAKYHGFRFYPTVLGGSVYEAIGGQ